MICVYVSSGLKLKGVVLLRGCTAYGESLWVFLSAEAIV